jgi:hypothetical protein
MYNLRGRSVSREPSIGGNQDSSSAELTSQAVPEAKPTWKQRLRNSSLARRVGKENDGKGAFC